jgi:dTDP-glucose 4,6-dehydratase
MNAFGERQYLEKFIPKVMNNILQGKTTYIHTYPDGKTPGSRFYIHGRNIADAVLFLTHNGQPGEIYNITGEEEVSNLDVALKVANIMGRPLAYELVSNPSDRPGHDIRYGISGDKLKALGWEPPVSFVAGLRKCVEWTLAHREWLEQ